ncbi:MAG TPA: hypothetical protein PL078_01635 [Bacillota bacterium]|jgi:hypothetical protein|nr:hypothetical protein [Peptococcaceae bacterium MAG4]NLW36973.1 hypothetical protein [Peptococcaceae bacterium]HPZ42681.1 hypothetical protein [Bacillota bacterium]HQD75675.1 hypothetical protein [Bacillota bacterium]HUM57945.1 hypothetical protein [Bacillota bacterium]
MEKSRVDEEKKDSWEIESIEILNKLGLRGKAVRVNSIAREHGLFLGWGV